MECSRSIAFQAGIYTIVFQTSLFLSRELSISRVAKRRERNVVTLTNSISLLLWILATSFFLLFFFFQDTYQSKMRKRQELCIRNHWHLVVVHKIDAQTIEKWQVNETSFLLTNIREQIAALSRSNFQRFHDHSCFEQLTLYWIHDCRWTVCM